MPNKKSKPTNDINPTYTNLRKIKVTYWVTTKKFNKNPGTAQSRAQMTVKLQTEEMASTFLSAFSPWLPLGRLFPLDGKDDSCISSD